MRLRTSTLIFMMLSGTALTQSLACTTLDDRPANDEGMTQVSDGLYTLRTGDIESYVAVSPAGQQALLARLIEIRATRAVPTANGVTSVIDGLISTLSQPQPLAVLSEQTGDCNGLNLNGPLHVKALAGGGVGGGDFGASSIAQNNDGFSPPLDTTNFASAETIDRNGNITHHQATTTHGPGNDAIATAFVIGAAGCDADSSATVTCPGHTKPSITAFTAAHLQTCIRN